jgi:hypothetical protein
VPGLDAAPVVPGLDAAPVVPGLDAATVVPGLIDASRRQRGPHPPPRMIGVPHRLRTMLHRAPIRPP